MSKKNVRNIDDIIIAERNRAFKEVDTSPESQFTKTLTWPVKCVVGPGLEGAIACESKVGYVNGSKGWLIYRGYNIFDLCIHSSFEEVSYLLLYGQLPAASEFSTFNKELKANRNIVRTIRLLMAFPVEKMNAMAGLRLGTNLMRQEFTYVDHEAYRPDFASNIYSDEDSIPMETVPRGESQAIYEFRYGQGIKKPRIIEDDLKHPASFETCYRLISGIPTLVGAISKIRSGSLPINSDPKLSHAGNLLYMITGRKPTSIEERIMDICLILHADHGMNASTFATMVVASTLSDIFFAAGAGIAALNGPLHGGANEKVLNMLKEIGSPSQVKSWYKDARRKKKKIMGFGHRVYKAYDPRARILAPLAEYLVKFKGDKELQNLFNIAQTLEKEVVGTLGVERKIFTNVDFYSGIVYTGLGIAPELFTPLFAVSRISGWTARVMEYLKANRIFRPRAIYSGEFNNKYKPINKRR